MMDHSLFLLGGSTWLNLVNTRFIHNKQLQDVLMDQTNALHWLETNHLLRLLDSPPGSDSLSQICAELISLRRICMEALSSLEHQAKLSEDVFNSLKERAEQLSIVTVVTSIEGQPSLNYEGKTTVDHVLYRVIRSIFDTLDTYPTDRIRKCEHEECILHFLDTSKSGKRRWCSMEVCGNRHKAAEFYAKKKMRNLAPMPTDKA